MAENERFRTFIRKVTVELNANPPTNHCPAALLDDFSELVAVDDWLPDIFGQPGEDSYRQYLLYCDPLERFSIVSFVWAPGQQTPIHDHTVWGAIGQLRGNEISTPFKRDARGHLVQQEGQISQPGAIISFTPEEGDIHSVLNPGPDLAISIHVYGGNIGSVLRSTFDPETGNASAFISGYSNELIPNIWQ